MATLISIFIATFKATFKSTWKPKDKVTGPESFRVLTQLNQKGQGLIEYIIIVALVAVATIGVVRVLGQAVNSRFATISYALQGVKKTPSVDPIEENHLRKRDLGNFMDGVGGGRGDSP